MRKVENVKWTNVGNDYSNTSANTGRSSKLLDITMIR